MKMRNVVALGFLTYILLLTAIFFATGCGGTTPLVNVYEEDAGSLVVEDAGTDSGVEDAGVDAGRSPPPHCDLGKKVGNKHCP